MKLSTRGRYGIHAMFDLAREYKEGVPQPIKTIAERQRIPDAYLEQLISALRKAGLVTSVRGAQGGYMLARKPEEITVGEVLRVLEGELATVECLEFEDACDRACACPTRLVWQKIQDGVNAIVDGITLGDMLCDDARMRGEE
ncbi:MAG: Rrf2 family transcriptional regulator [Clostridiales bacterium]|nr:Rrf2 family transcriptional regulator [Clostridiales bacterium]